MVMTMIDVWLLCNATTNAERKLTEFSLCNDWMDGEVERERFHTQKNSSRLSVFGLLLLLVLQ